MTVVQALEKDDIGAEMARIGAAARAAARLLAVAEPEQKNTALEAAAAAIRDRRAAILDANAKDLGAAGDAGATAAFLDRLALDDGRVEAMAAGLEAIAAFPDPVGRVLAEWERPNGLRISRVSVPLGVIGIIYESRPNVTADSGGLCLKSGNAAILRGGSESFHAARAIAECLGQGLTAAGLPEACIQLLPFRDRAAVGIMLGMVDDIDVIVPRGGRGLIERVAAESRIPVIKHLDGICHVYVDRAADPEMARKVVLNAKMRRTGICGAAETLLVDRQVAASHLPPILDDLAAAGCELRGEAAVQALDPRVVAAGPEDWDTEYLDAIISVKLVDGVDAAIEHVNRHGSQHTDAIVTKDDAAAERFVHLVDSDIVMVNA